QPPSWGFVRTFCFGGATHPGLRAVIVSRLCALALEVDRQTSKILRPSAAEIVHDSRDRELGMHRKISRRDFLNGVAVTTGAAMMPWDLAAAGFGKGQAVVGSESSPGYYP